MTSDDFVELYESLRGGPAANHVLDAEAAYMQQNYAAALKTMRFARDGYHSSRLRVLRDEAAGNPALQSKREKAQRILQRFDTLIVLLADAVEKHPTPIRHPDLPDRFASQYAAATTADERLDYIYLAFAVTPVKQLDDLVAGGLYFIASEHKTFCVQVDDPLPDGLQVPMRAVDTGKRLPDMTRQQFMELGQRGWLVRLGKKAPKAEPASSAAAVTAVAEKAAAGQAAEDLAAADLGAGSAETGESPFDVHERDKILDVGAFTQLLDSAHRSGMLPESDQIAHVRDREFRRGHFQKALLTMEGLQGKFSAAATMKQAEIRREDAAIASGRIKMSPKDLQAKRMRDQAASQAIERARSRFSRVLDGLRILARTMNVE